MRAMIFKTTCGQKRAIAGHAARVMIAAFHFIPGVTPGGMIAVVDRARYRQAFGDQSFPDHVSGDLVLEAIHALVKVASRPVRPFAFCLLIIPIGTRESAHE